MDSGRLGGLFCDLYRRRFTGLLRVESDDGHAAIGFREGVPVSTEDSSRVGRLGTDLVERGSLNRAQYAAVIARVTDGLVEHEDLAFCEHAVELGFLSEEQARSELSERTRTQLIQALAMRDCQCSFDEGEHALLGQGEYPQELGAIVYMGVRTFYDEELLRRYVPEPSINYLRLLAPVTSIGEFFALDHDETKLLRAIDPESPIDTLVHASIVDASHAYAIIALLRIAQLGEFATKPFAPEQTTAAISGGRSASRQGMPAVQPRPASQSAMAAVTTKQLIQRSSSQQRMRAATPARGSSSQVEVVRQPSQQGMPAQRPAAQNDLRAEATRAASSQATPAQRPPSQNDLRAEATRAASSQATPAQRPAAQNDLRAETAR
ncbi:MAG TPA: DUF4388 domain-containing protein, partial [Polyangiales bacterium]